MADTILNLNELDSTGEWTGESRTTTLASESIQDIIDSARSLAIQFDAGAPQDEIDASLSNLHEALDSYGLLDAAAPKP